jgi:hypothetical protein
MTQTLLLQVCRRGGVFHLWGHSWEIAENKEWPQLERCLAYLGKHKDQALCVTNSELC